MGVGSEPRIRGGVRPGETVVRERTKMTHGNTKPEARAGIQDPMGHKVRGQSWGTRTPSGSLSQRMGWDECGAAS